MATPWWARVNPGDLNIDGYRERSRKLATVVASTRFRDEPELAAAWMNADVPLSLVQRADAVYTSHKSLRRRELLERGGLSNSLNPVANSAANSILRKGQDGWGLVRGFGEGVLGALNKAYSIIETPMAAGTAAPDTDIERWLKSGESSIIPLAPVARPLIEGAIDYAKGWSTVLIGNRDLSQDQRDQMEAQGYDPESFASRYAWYYNDWMEPGRKPVATSDIERWQQEYNPRSVDHVVEIVTSNFLNDNNPAALSPGAQEFVRSISGADADPRDKELLERAMRSSTLTLGGHVASAFGLEPGTSPHTWTSVAFDIIGYWKVDPVAGALRLGTKEVQFWRYGTPADDLAEVKNRIAAVATPGDLTSRPATAAGRAFDEMMDVADRVYVLQRANTPESLAQAAQLTNRFALQHPDMMTHFGLVSQLRAGSISAVRMKDDARLAQEAADGARRGYQLSPFTVRAADAGEELKPIWALRSTPDEQVSQVARNEARAKVADLIGDVVWLEAVGSGRPLYRGQVLLPGQVAINRRLRSALQPLRDGLTRADRTFVRSLDEAKSLGAVRLNGELDNPNDLIVSNAMGEWTRANYTRSRMGQSLARVAANFDKSFSGKRLTFDTPEGTELYRRLVTQFLPRRAAYAAVNRWAMGSPAERMALYRQTMEAVVEAAGMRNTPAARQLIDIMTKGSLPAADEVRRTGPLEVYTANGADNLINIGDHKMAAGVHSFQMADGVILPNLREIRQLQQITGLFSLTGHFFNSAPLSGLIGAWKVGKVGNFANMFRQLTELVVMSAEQGPGQLARMAGARRQLAAANVEAKLTKNDLARAAGEVADNATTGDLDRLNKLMRDGDYDAYRGAMIRILQREGIEGRHADIIAQMADGVPFDEYMRVGKMSNAALAMAGPLDALRRARLAFMKRTGNPTIPSSPWQQSLDEKFLDDITTSALQDLDSAVDAYPMLARQSYVDDVMDGVNKGFGFRRARIPNAFETVGTAGDRGAMYWADAQNVRQRDALGRFIQQAIALEARLPRIREARIRRAARAAEGSEEFTALAESATRSRAAADDLFRRLNESGSKPPAKKDPTALRLSRLGPKVAAARAKVLELEAAGKDTTKAQAALDKLVEQEAALQEASAAWVQARAPWDELSSYRAEARTARTRMTELRRQYRTDAEERYAALNSTSLLNEVRVARALRTDPRLQAIDDPVQRAEMERTIREGVRVFDDMEITNAADLTRYLIGRAPEGEALRLQSRRLQYTENGEAITSPQQFQEAVERLSRVMFEDHVRHMGGVIDETGQAAFDDSLRPIVNRISAGSVPGPATFARVPEEFRPDAVAAHLYIPDLPKPARAGLVNLAAKAYAFTVARPLSRLGTTPAFIANRDSAYRALEPVYNALADKGLSAQQASGLLEYAASRYAINATFRGTDQATEHSVFSELADNFLMFQRAFEDFTRRVMRVTAADASLIARGAFLIESAVHSGVLYPQAEQDDEGNTRTNLVLTFPGSAAMMKTLQDFGRAMGWGDSDVVAQPLYSSLSSQVRFINPSLSNPLGFSTNPLIGMPLRIVRGLYPEVDQETTAFLSLIEGGGETFFAEQNILQSILPTPISRLVPVMTPGEATAQLASSIRNAQIHYMAAGLLPEPDASDDEWEEAHDAIRSMAENQLVWRSVLAFFSPLPPAANAPAGLGLPDEANLIDQARGITSIRSEWFNLIEQYSSELGSEQGFAEAAIEWARRYPRGRSIVNPEAFLVGTTRAPGTAAEAGSFSSGPHLTQWMLDNKQWLERHRSIAYYLLPSDPDAYFSPAGQRAQLRNGLREHKGTEEMLRDLRFQTGQREFWDMFNRKNALIALNPEMRSQINAEFAEWSRDWKIANPASARRLDERNDPNYVHGELSAALDRLIEDEANAPAEIRAIMPDVIEMRDYYARYRQIYNSTANGDDGVWDRRNVSSEYRRNGSARYLNTQLADLWRAFDVYEDA